MRRSSFRGITLLEVMIVVAIVGILSVLGGGALMNAVKTSRVSGAAKEMMAMARAARTRAMASSCPHFIQLNGRSYAGPAAAPSRPSTIYLVRKAACASTLPFFAPGDKIVDSAVLGSEMSPGSVITTMPPALLATQELVGQSVTVAYDGGGNLSMALDTGGGFAVVVPPINPLTVIAAASGTDLATLNCAVIQPMVRCVAITSSGVQLTP